MRFPVYHFIIKLYVTKVPLINTGFRNCIVTVLVWQGKLTCQVIIQYQLKFSITCFHLPPNT